MEATAQVHRTRSDEAKELEFRLKRMTPPGTAVFVELVDDYTSKLFPEELEAIANSVNKRRQEFSTGRMLARRALSQLGREAAAIPVGTRREPLWPEGITGSVSHTHGLCAVILTRVAEVRAIGLDLAWSQEVSIEVMASISTPEEISQNRREMPDGELAACLFSAREAMFKAYNTITQSFLDFRDVEIHLDSRNARFEAHLVNPLRPSLLGRRTIEGRYDVARGYAVAVVATMASRNCGGPS